MSTPTPGKAAKPLESILGHAALIAVSLVFAVPFVWLVLTSLKTNKEIFVDSALIFANPGLLLPGEWRWSNYLEAVREITFMRYTLNTLFVAAAGTLGMLVSCSLAAYGFAIVRWRWSNAMFLLMLATLMLPPQVTMIPLFVLFQKLDWVGTYRPLIVPAFFGGAFYIFMLRQFFRTVPRDLVDAARIDGCSHLDIYLRVVLPLSRPALAVVAFFTFTGYWNDFLGPLIYLNDDSKYTLSLGLQQFLGQHSARWELLMAASTLMILPIIIIFFLLQRTFVQGIAMTGLKG